MPFDPNILTQLLPLLAGATGDPQHRAGVMQGFLQTKQRLDQEALQQQGMARQNQLAQAQISHLGAESQNLSADNARADSALKIQQQNADLNRLLHFREAAGQQAGTIAESATDPLAAQNELATQGVGMRQDFGVPPTTTMPTPDMAGMISNRKKKRAGDLYAEAEKRFGPEAMANDSITLQSPEFGQVKPSQLRTMFETPAVNTPTPGAAPSGPSGAPGTPATPYVKQPTPGTEAERAQTLIGKVRAARAAGDTNAAAKFQQQYDDLVKVNSDLSSAKRDPLAEELAKQRLTDLQNSNAPLNVQTDVQTTRSGRKYIDISTYQGAEKAKAQAAASKAGVPVVGKEQAEALQEIDNARMNLEGIYRTLVSKLPKDASGRLTKGLENKLSAFFQTQPDLAAFGLNRTAAIQAMRAAAGSKGLRINRSEIAMSAENDIPNITDTAGTALTRLTGMLKLLENGERSILTRNRSSLTPATDQEVLPSDLQPKTTGPRFDILSVK